ncbi:PhoU family transcriptional regulator [Bhargavaea cecembensis]|uniref:Phosphate-specific transport system accessory protein PhoU n=1 Tax=Bhargavaea cecembensis TaxID=394098 RepID=A0A165GTF8_9BACL|nr:phosphate signaling complex protein PhoU [Bhargavaea cecembensis]KZE37614.1 PhoU family transcriptional regulator [Bhargavaea cecembensis]
MGNVRKTFESELEELKGKLLRMVDLAERQLGDSMDALKTQNLTLANAVKQKDAEINTLDEEINQKVIQLITQQQPVATDLRKIIVALKISTDVERIGDLAVNIAKSTLHIGEEPLIKPIVDIPKMADAVRVMLRKAFDAYDLEDIDLAFELAKEDDAIDEAYGRMIQELMGYMHRNPDHVNQITQLAFISRHLERVGDHVTNMAENIIFMVKGKTLNLNE